MRGEEEKLIEKAEMTILCFVFFWNISSNLSHVLLLEKGDIKG